MSLAVQIRQHGGPEELQIVDVTVGEPGPGEIRIRHHAIGLNFIDVYHRTGLYPLSMPATIGMEAAGVVEAVGEGVGAGAGAVPCGAVRASSDRGPIAGARCGRLPSNLVESAGWPVEYACQPALAWGRTLFPEPGSST